jgi:hypothetical protein
MVLTTSQAALVFGGDGNHNNEDPDPTVYSFFIHKLGEGTYFVDPLCATRRSAFKAGGGRWGLYWFASGEDNANPAVSTIGQACVARLKMIGYEPDDTIWLDFEESDSFGGSNMSVQAALSFCATVEAAFPGWHVGIYGSDMVLSALQGGHFMDRPVWYAWVNKPAGYVPTLPSGKQIRIQQPGGESGGGIDYDYMTPADFATWPNLPA